MTGRIITSLAFAGAGLLAASGSPASAGDADSYYAGECFLEGTAAQDNGLKKSADAVFLYETRQTIGSGEERQVVVLILRSGAVVDRAYFDRVGFGQMPPRPGGNPSMITFGGFPVNDSNVPEREMAASINFNKDNPDGSYIWFRLSQAGTKSVYVCPSSATIGKDDPRRIKFVTLAKFK